VSVDWDPYARFGVRVAAGVMDLVLLACAAAVLTWLGLEFQAAALENRSELFEAIVQLWRKALLFPVLVLVVAVMALCWARVCATPGQLLLGSACCGVGARRRSTCSSHCGAPWRCLPWPVRPRSRCSACFSIRAAGPRTTGFPILLWWSRMSLEFRWMNG